MYYTATCRSRMLLVATSPSKANQLFAQDQRVGTCLPAGVCFYFFPQQGVGFFSLLFYCSCTALRCPIVTQIRISTVFFNEPNLTIVETFSLHSLKATALFFGSFSTAFDSAVLDGGVATRWSRPQSMPSFLVLQVAV